jgi:hypothetical protein
MESIEFQKLLDLLIQVYGKPLTKGGLAGYYEVLQKCEYNDLKEAVRVLLLSHKYRSVPLPAEIHEIACKAKSERIKKQAIVAFKKVEKAIHDVGWEKSVIFDDPIIHLVINQMNPWPAFCRNYWCFEGLYKEQQGNNFIKLYQKVDQKNEIIPLELKGESDEIICIGDVEVAKKWVLAQAPINKKLGAERMRLRNENLKRMTQEKEWRAKLNKNAAQKSAQVKKTVKNMTNIVKKPFKERLCFVCKNPFPDKLTDLEYGLVYCNLHSKEEAKKEFYRQMGGE